MGIFTFVIASDCKERSNPEQQRKILDCFVASLLAMTHTEELGDFLIQPISRVERADGELQIFLINNHTDLDFRG